MTHAIKLIPLSLHSWGHDGGSINSDCDPFAPVQNRLFPFRVFPSSLGHLSFLSNHPMNWIEALKRCVALLIDLHCPISCPVHILPYFLPVRCQWPVPKLANDRLDLVYQLEKCHRDGDREEINYPAVWSKELLLACRQGERQRRKFPVWLTIV